MRTENMPEMLSEVRKKYFSKNSVLADEAAVRPEWKDGAWYLQMAEDCLRMLGGTEALSGARCENGAEVPSEKERESGAEASSEKERESGAEALSEKRRESGAQASSMQAQARALYTLKAQFHANMAGRNKGALSGEERKRYLALCSRCLRRISNDLISAEESMTAQWRLLHLEWSALMRLKYEHAKQSFYIKDGRLYCEDDGMNQEPGLLPFVTLDLMEYEQGRLHLDCCVDRFLLEGSLTFEIRINGRKAPYRVVPRYAAAGFFGETLTERIAAAVECEVRTEEVVFEFILKDNRGGKLVLPVAAVDYQARLTGLLQNSYWCFDRCMAVFRRGADGRANGIRILPAGKLRRLLQEVRLLREMVRAPYGSRQMFAVRCAYWATRPLYAGKKIWITFDKLYKGGDCGEYFYKYMMTRRKDGVTPVYVMRKDAADFQRLRREGYAPAAYRSLKQRLLYLNADMVFATHSGVHSFCGFSKWEIRFLQDRLHAVNTCIQHGLSVQDLTVDSNRVINNNKRYYCASHCEIENLSQPAYDYGPEVLRLTGIPRYDGLKDCSGPEPNGGAEKDSGPMQHSGGQILITPTWRSYLAMPPVMGDARAYNPEFKQTDYYKIFQELLENPELLEAAQKNGYRIIYLLHPVISAQKKDFHTGRGVELLAATEADYEKLLTQSALMVTDYSGVQFDFAYMRKPVVYFHPPKLPPHYADGGFFYDRQGFGEICTDVQELVRTLKGYMEQGCRLKEFYRARQDDFFAYSDRESCRRIFEDALAYEAAGPIR